MKDDLTAAVLAAIADRRKVAGAAPNRGQWAVWCVRAVPYDSAREFMAAHDPTFALANLDAWEAVVRAHLPQPESDVGYLIDGKYGTVDPACSSCGWTGEYAVAWPCWHFLTAARLFLTAEQLAKYSIAETAPHAPHDRSVRGLR